MVSAPELVLENDITKWTIEDCIEYFEQDLDLTNPEVDKMARKVSYHLVYLDTFSSSL